jgi:hypothetical protein
MSDRARRSDEILGATVLVSGWSKGREAEVAEALDLLSKEPVDLAGIELPYVALEKVSLDKAETARGVLEAAGASVVIEDAWVTRDAPRPIASRPPCPFCGSTKTQPYTHAGPAARPSMKCTTCGQRFRV